MENSNAVKEPTAESFGSGPFFLKEIDISTEILKSDPNVKKDTSETNNITHGNNLLENPDEHSTKPNDQDPPDSELKEKIYFDTADLTSNETPTNSVGDQKKVENHFFPKQVEISDDVLKSNPREKTYPDVKISRKSSSFKGKTTESSSLTFTTNSQCSVSVRESSYISNLRVVVRVRPLSSAEQQHGNKICVSYPGGGSIQVEGANQCKSFTFNVILPEKCTQDDVFQQSGIKNLIAKALDGFSCTVFAFGPTGSGKTHTIIGPSEQIIEDLLDNQDLCGLIGRSFRYLFESANKRSSVQYIIKASFLEVYNEKVKDLLNPSNAYDSLPVRWSAKKGFYVENLFLMECKSFEDLMVLLVEGSNYRQFGVHAINEHSSRSHTIFTVYLESEEIDSDGEEGFPMIRHGKISFIDLAGSERVKETKTTMKGLAESNNINKSLLALGNCISALGNRKKRGHHIPYRESKLTKLLADSLSGEGFTLMIACISPSAKNSQDTMNALRYANRAKTIKNKPIVKMDPKKELVQKLKQEIKLLRRENNYFRQQQGIPNSESQIISTPNKFDGDLTPNSFRLKHTIGSETLPSLHSNRNNSSKEDNDLSPQTSLYAMNTLGAKNGLYDILQAYMNENESLKTENMDLHCSRAISHRQQEEMARENDRLTRKLDELERIDGSILSPTSDGNITVYGGCKTENIRFPSVRHRSYPNYVTVDASADLEHNKEKSTERTNQGTIFNKSNEDAKKLCQCNREKRSILTTEDQKDCNKDRDSSVKILHKKESIENRKNSQDMPCKVKKKLATVDKKSGYAAQFAVRKRKVSSTLSTRI